VIQAFVIKKDKNGKQISTMVGVWITNIMADQAYANCVCHCYAT